MNNYRFKGLRRGEKIYTIYHKRKIPFYKEFIYTPIIILISFLLNKFIPSIISFTYASLIGGSLALLLFLRAWYIWSKNVLLITNIRVIAVNQKGLFSREVIEAYLEAICNVGVRVRGVMPSMFKYGKVLIQTQNELWLDDVLSPYKFKEAVFSALRKQKTQEHDPASTKTPSSRKDSKFWIAKLRH